MRFIPTFCALKLISYYFLSVLVKKQSTRIIGNAKICSRRQGSIFRKKGILKTFHIISRKEMYQFYLKISKINENVNIIFIPPETLTSCFDVALNKRNAGQGVVFCVWLFSCNSSMSLAFRKWFLRLNVIFRLQLNV